MASGVLVKDAQDNILARGHRTVGRHREYEFTFPQRNDDLGDTLWEREHTYMVAVLVGLQPMYAGINDAVWMSDQVLIRVGSPATESIYRPPLGAAASPTHEIPGEQNQHQH